MFEILGFWMSGIGGCVTLVLEHQLQTIRPMVHDSFAVRF